MKARYTAQKTATFTPETARRIEQATEQLNMSVVQVIRECVENDLPKLLDRPTDKGDQTMIIRIDDNTAIATEYIRRYQVEKYVKGSYRLSAEFNTYKPHNDVHHPDRQELFVGTETQCVKMLTDIINALNSGDPSFHIPSHIEYWNDAS